MLSDKPVILVANGADWTARSLRSVLESGGYAVAVAATGRHALASARAIRPDAVIVAQQMPDGSGLHVCRQLRGDGDRGAVLPIIVTTDGAGERAARLEAYESGAWDFCVEPVDGEILLRKLSHFVRSRRAIERARQEGLLDESTELYNRRGLARRAREIGAGAIRRREALACLVVGSRRATAGEAPDEAFITALTEHIASVIRRCVRESDVCGRLSRSEIAVVAPTTGPVGAARLAERLRAAVETSPLVESAVSARLAVGISAYDDFGAAHLGPLELLDEAALDARMSARSREGAGEASSPSGLRVAPPAPPA
jgi:two-component system cell cycle response regulator